ncbi:unnamed protein product [Prunus brigantina]
MHFGLGFRNNSLNCTPPIEILTASNADEISFSHDVRSIGSVSLKWIGKIKVDLAKTLYHENGLPFRLEHCFAILKNVIKWSTVDVDMSPSATMSPNLDIDLDSDEQGESVPETQYNSEILRPKRRAIGRKAAKIAKQKGVADSESNVKYNSALSSFNSRRETMDEYKVMLVETKDMTPDRNAYWKYQQKKIMKACQASQALEFDDEMYHPDPPPGFDQE